jgi:hypothetical protein
LIWAGAALGAALQRRTDAQQFLLLAKQHIRYCYDKPTYESIIALLTVALASYKIEQPGTFFKYVNLAFILYTEIQHELSSSPAQQACVLLEYTRRLVQCEPMFIDQEASETDGFIEEYSTCRISGWPDAPTTDLEHKYEPMRRLLIIWDNNTKIVNTTEQADPLAYRAMLERIVVEAEHMQDLGLNHSPYAAMLNHVSVLLPYCRLGRLDQCVQTSRQCLALIEKYPVILTRPRKCSVIFMLLDIIELLGDDSVRERVILWRTRAPRTDLIPGLEGDNEENYFKYVKRELLITLSQPPSSSEGSAPGVLTLSLQSEHAVAADLALQEYLDDTNFISMSLEHLEQLMSDEGVS